MATANVKVTFLCPIEKVCGEVISKELRFWMDAGLSSIQRMGFQRFLKSHERKSISSGDLN